MASGVFPNLINTAICKAALFAFNHCSANCFDLGGSFLLSHLSLANQLANDLALVPEMSDPDLSLDPAVLLLRCRYASFVHSHACSSKGRIFEHTT